EAVVRTNELNYKLKVLEMARSGKAPDMRQLEIDISKQDLEKEQAKLRQLIDQLDTDRKAMDYDIAIIKSRIENSKAMLEASLVRSPLDGVVVQLFARQG